MQRAVLPEHELFAFDPRHVHRLVPGRPADVHLPSRLLRCWLRDEYGNDAVAGRYPRQRLTGIRACSNVPEHVLGTWDMFATGPLRLRRDVLQRVPLRGCRLLTMYSSRVCVPSARVLTCVHISGVQGRRKPGVIGAAPRRGLLRRPDGHSLGVDRDRVHDKISLNIPLCIYLGLPPYTLAPRSGLHRKLVPGSSSSSSSSLSSSRSTLSSSSLASSWPPM